ncbi:hypothetical protein JD79_04329 [Geodermatophilus normandii]|uniref:Uncharacterized protein n=1 Tax=Geodermatophilus normandii TaxID=1137989 RepID=A0A317QQ29_9ACTN|nr:hypothetical protein JD79_04329 [Geodermatophilus normandii]
MYWTTPSGTRYQTGIPRATRSRQSVELIASAGISTRLTAPSGRCPSARVKPGRVTPTKWASRRKRSLSRQLRICDSASAPVMKNSSASGRWACRSERVSMVYVGPSRSTSTRLTENRGLEAVAMTVMR